MVNVLLCVGNCMMGDDGAGPLLAELCEAHPPEGWEVIDGGPAPENDIYYVKELNPEKVVIVDATQMGLAPGETRIVDENDIAEMFMATTHNMPLTFLIDQIKEVASNVIFIGIQPTAVAFYEPVSEPVKVAVTELHRRLSDWGENGGYERLNLASRNA
ncbi:hydrogenase maturation peptidase HycI [Acetobacteraceae bacterium]|nr:hydrogenase maturation peptidase HycI [Acetobacteraceae bacterium]